MTATSSRSPIASDTSLTSVTGTVSGSTRVRPLASMQRAHVAPRMMSTGFSFAAWRAGR